MLIFSAPFAGWSIETLGIPTTYVLAGATILAASLAVVATQRPLRELD